MKRTVNSRSAHVSSTDKNSEAVVKACPKGELKEYLSEILCNYRFLDGVALEAKKEEASKPLYLTRYE